MPLKKAFLAQLWGCQGLTSNVFHQTGFQGAVFIHIYHSSSHIFHMIKYYCSSNKCLQTNNTSCPLIKLRSFVSLITSILVSLCFCHHHICWIFGAKGPSDSANLDYYEVEMDYYIFTIHHHKSNLSYWNAMPGFWRKRSKCF